MTTPNKTPDIASSRLQPRILYLTTYNILFASLWSSVFVTTLFYASSSKISLFQATSPQTRWIQTTSLLEVLHAASGLVKAPASTTALQVVTRVIQVWMVWYRFPSSTASSRAYLALLLAWSVADMVRYGYLALKLHGRAPRWVAWVRYTMFYPLYPVGIAAEWWLLYQAIAPGRKVSVVIPPVFYFCLMLYIPGAYTMYMYMIKQRKKTLGSRWKDA